MWLLLIIILISLALVFIIVSNKEAFCAFQKVEQPNFGVAPSPVYNCPLNWYPLNPDNDKYRPYQPKYATIPIATW